MMRGVRIPASKEKPAAMRRRPVQSRAYASSQALQEAFVRVLIEEGFEKTTVLEMPRCSRVVASHIALPQLLHAQMLEDPCHVSALASFSARITLSYRVRANI
jgi:hypothetical protein